MGERKARAPWRIEGKMTAADSVTLSSAATVGGTLTCSTGITVASSANFNGRVKASTSVDVPAATIVDVVEQPSTVETTALTGAGGLSIIGSTSTLVYQLPTSTAGTLMYVFWSSGASAIVSPADTTNTKIWGTPSTGKLATTVTGSTGDFALFIAQSSSQWNLLSHSSNITSSS